MSTIAMESIASFLDDYQYHEMDTWNQETSMIFIVSGLMLQKILEDSKCKHIPIYGSVRIGNVVAHQCLFSQWHL